MTKFLIVFVGIVLVVFGYLLSNAIRGPVGGLILAVFQIGALASFIIGLRKTPILLGVAICGQVVFLVAILFFSSVPIGDEPTDPQEPAQIEDGDPLFHLEEIPFSPE